MAEVFIRPISQLSRRAWKARDRADRRAGISLTLAMTSLIAIPLLAGLEFLVASDVHTVFHTIDDWIESQFGLWPKSWSIWLLLLLTVVLIAALVKWGRTALLSYLAVVGPLLLIGFYLGFCIFTINSSNILPGPTQQYELGLKEYQATGNQVPLQAAVDEILVNKQYLPANYVIDFDSIKNIPLAQAELEVNRGKAPGITPWWYQFTWLRPLTTTYRPRLTISHNPLEHSRLFIPELAITQFHAEWWVYIGALLLWLFNYLIVNVNRMSLHPFYRDRLSRTFLIRPSGENLESADDLLLSELRAEHSTAPYHLVNTALNLQGARDPQLRQRKTVPFLLSKRFCGSDYTGYCQTVKMEDIDRNLNLGTAMAVSAGAAGPTMGVKTIKSLTFMMTLLNIRLAYWLPNPSWMGQEKWWHWLVHRNPGLACLLIEAQGMPSDHYRFVNCSDGGHIENLGVYELLKRRCRMIICVDSGGDAKFNFYDLTTLQRYANIDLNTQINIDPEPLIPDQQGVSRQQYVIGKIKYPNGQLGTLIYIKLAVTDKEPEYIRFYKRGTPAFPHESTADQFFNETKFEVYRALGEFAAERTFADEEVRGQLGKTHNPGKSQSNQPE